MAVRTVVERGRKGKRSVAFAIDWPGWSRGARSPEQALETLEAYRSRYRLVAVGAGLQEDFDAAGVVEVVEDRIGTGSTDFWGISFSPSSFEQDPMDPVELKRKLRLVRAAWAHFDAVGVRVSPEMRRGPRGGGRDRDRIIRHTIRTESEDFAKRVGLRIPEEGALGDALPAYRDAYVDAMWAYQRGETHRRMTTWTLPFLVRHTAFHVLDHAWEMEDKDLTGEAGA
jgi:hypothetical protein